MKRKVNRPMPNDNENLLSSVFFEKDYVIGMLLGEIVWRTKMPTLSNDYIQSGVVISVSEEDRMRGEELNNILSANYPNDPKSKEWLDWLAYNLEMAFKYLPHTFEYRTILPIETNDLVIKGIRDYLWGSDGCPYSLDLSDIKIIENKFLTIIKFYLRS